MPRLFCFCMLLALCTSSLLARDFSSNINNINAAGFPKIEVTLKVFNRQPEELKTDNFTISEDKTPITDFSLSAGKNRHFMLLVIDRSSSIEPAMNEVKKAAADFVNSMVSDVQISILSFGSDLDFNHRFSSDAKSLNEAIFKIRPWGGTALYDAIYAACEELATQAGRNDLKTVVCLTDGRDSRPNGQSPLSTRTPDEVVSLASEKGIRIITVGLGNDIDEYVLKNFAGKTKGWYLKSTSAEQLSKLYQALSQRMKLEKYYRLSYRTPKPEPDGSKREVDIISRLKDRQDQGSGEYTAPKRTVHIPAQTDSLPDGEKMSLEMVFYGLHIDPADTVYLTGPIIPPPYSPVIGPNAAAFLGNSKAENQAIIEQAGNRIAHEHQKNYQSILNWLSDYSKTLNRLQAENDKNASSPSLKDFEKPRIDYRNRYLKSRRDEIELYEQKAWNTYQVRLQESMDELDYYQRHYVLAEAEDDDFFRTNAASASAALEKIDRDFEQKIDECRRKRDEMFKDTLEARGAKVTTPKIIKTIDMPGFRNRNRQNDADTVADQDADQNEILPDINDDSFNVDQNFDMDSQIPDIKEIAPFD